MKFFKKTLSILLSAALVLSLCPVSSANNVYAADYSGLKKVSKKYSDLHLFHEGLARVTIKQVYNGYSHYGYVNNKGKLVFSVKCDDAGDFHDGLAKIEKKGKFGFINKKGKVVIPCKFDEAGSFEKGICSVGKKYGDDVDDELTALNCRSFINKKGKRILPYNHLFVTPHTKDLIELKYIDIYEDITTYTFCNSKGKSVNPNTYIIRGPKDRRNNFYDGRMFVGRQVGDDVKYGYIDLTGKEVIPAQYDNGERFGDGLAAVSLNGEDLIINTNGDIVLRDKKIVRNFSEGLAVVSDGDGYGYMDKTGAIVIPGKYDDANQFKNGFASVAKEINGKLKWGFINKEGKEITPLKYDYCTDFSEGLACVSLKGKTGFINEKGKLVIPFKYDDYAASFEDGLALVGKYVDPHMDGPSLYIDKKGKVVIQSKSGDDVSFFSEGLAIVDGHYVDRKGKVY